MEKRKKLSYNEQLEIVTKIKTDIINMYKQYSESKGSRGIDITSYDRFDKVKTQFGRLYEELNKEEDKLIIKVYKEGK